MLGFGTWIWWLVLGALYGYDWFKLVVAVVLGALLIPFQAQPAAQLSATPQASVAVAPSATAPTAEPVAALTAPSLDRVLATTPGALTLSGQGAPGAVVKVSVDGAEVGTTTVDANGGWRLETALGEGRHEIVATTSDAAGATAASSAPLVVNVASISPPSTAVAEGATLEPGQITVSGTGAAGTTLEILNDDKVLGETSVGGDGNWSTSVELAEGTAALGVRAKGASDLLGRPVRVTVGNAVLETCTSLAVGCQTWVTRAGGQVLRMRSGPSVSADIVTRLPIGTQMEVLEGPQPADDFTWWGVCSTGGSEGWVAGENLVLQPD